MLSWKNWVAESLSNSGDVWHMSLYAASQSVVRLLSTLCRLYSPDCRLYWGGGNRSGQKTASLSDQRQEGWRWDRSLPGPTEPGGEPPGRPQRRPHAAVWRGESLFRIRTPALWGPVAWCRRGLRAALCDRASPFGFVSGLSLSCCAFDMGTDLRWCPLMSTDLHLPAGTLTWCPFNLTQDPGPFWRTPGPTCHVWVALPPLVPAWGQPRCPERTTASPTKPLTRSCCNLSCCTFARDLGGECRCGVYNLEHFLESKETNTNYFSYREKPLSKH